jgi:uncharacterized membrane protein YhiD involved in acid resistance
MTIPIEQAAINLAVALSLSAVIGFERQWRANEQCVLSPPAQMLLRLGASALAKGV